MASTTTFEHDAPANKRADDTRSKRPRTVGAIPCGECDPSHGVYSPRAVMCDGKMMCPDCAGVCSQCDNRKKNPHNEFYLCKIDSVELWDEESSDAGDAICVLCQYCMEKRELVACCACDLMHTADDIDDAGRCVRCAQDMDRRRRAKRAARNK